MSAKQLLFHEAARERIRHGVDALAEAVKVTLGPRGRTVIRVNGTQRSAAIFPAMDMIDVRVIDRHGAVLKQPKTTGEPA